MPLAFNKRPGFIRLHDMKSRSFENRRRQPVDHDWSASTV
jgi:hypothetical protein